MNKKLIKNLIIIIMLVFSLGVMIPAQASVNSPTKTESEFKMAFRKIWEDHITWTRMVIVGIVDNVPGTDQATTRLLKNYDDMEEAMTPFYGAKESGVFGDLMKAHLVIAADFVKAAAAGDSVKAADLEKQWYDNAKAMSVQLNKMNSKNWPKDAVYSMMKDHLKYTKAEAVARISKDYLADINAYDNIHAQALMMADSFSNGIIKQYPSKVAKWMPEVTVMVSSKTGLGKFLVTADGMTLYTFKNDTKNKSNCVDQCASNWIPLSDAGYLVAGSNVKGALSKIERADGISQVTYNGWPLYTWIKDTKAGDTTGNNFNKVWFVVKP